jgi:ribose/xylose/arabinose/galactoside ABC-type transport system permease subunit
MNRVRGVVLLAAGVLALWKGWMIHRGQMAVMAYSLAVLALALGVWHLTRRAAPPRV